ncbi:MAG: hypothetical protein BWY83_01585 [bacterium ADurb.Bin478]|nr:MAG: hypothetical protein BWY83_01585 [bacterium ADurb.Bin478]
MDEKTCCPEFDPAPWDDKTFEWAGKKFIKEKVRTLLYMPLNFGSVMRRLDAMVTGAGGYFAGGLCLSDHTSKWNMDVYLAVDREIPGAENTSLSGTFFTKVYEGPFKDTGKWCADFQQLAKNKGLEVKKWYMWYTTCPKCAKKYGKNYTVVVAQV